MVSRTFLLMGKYDSLNKLIGATNYNRYVGAGIKKRNTKRFADQLVGEEPVEKHGRYRFNWHLSDRRTDPDNIASAHKFFFDGMQEANVLPNDNWDYVKSLQDEFFHDAPKGMEYVEVVVTYD